MTRKARIPPTSGNYTAISICCAAGLVATTLAVAESASARIGRVERGLTSQNAIAGRPIEGRDLRERMRHYRVPGVSIAVVDGGKLAWARAYGVVEAGRKQRVTPETLFQAGSISKPVTALAVLRLVERGSLTLDSDVNDSLTSWKIPDASVTLRQLLAHRAGMTVHGFAGYAAGGPVPTLLQILDGLPPANSPPIRANAERDDEVHYSGGGYTVVQQLLLDVTHASFPALLEREALAPLGMNHSTFEQPLPDAWASRASAGHDAGGQVIRGRWNTYPEMAAAGLWTTAPDLAGCIIGVQESLHGGSSALGRELAAQLSGGLGFFTGGEGDAAYFVHDGATAGFQALLVGFGEHGRGASILTNATHGLDLAHEIVRAIAVEYGWPALGPELKTTVAVDPKFLADFAGHYVGRDGNLRVDLTTHVERGMLRAQTSYWSGERSLYPLAENRYFTLEGDWEFEFRRGADGTVEGLQVGPLTMERVK
jgi:CubicO group peptidase (beta-lactamase class C family)